MIKPVLIGGVSLVLGLVIGAGLVRTPTSDPQANSVRTAASASSGTSLAHLQPVSGPAASLDAGQMRAILREELGAALTSALANSGGNGRSELASTQASAPLVTASPQQQQDALQAANDIIAGGQWGDEERISFHQQLAQLNPAQAEQAMQTLVQAIDSGSLNVSTEGPPL
jgi:hypothetical protein